MIKLFISDMDGVLTDGSMYYTEHGDEIKKFSTYDGMAFEILRSRGVMTAILTSENTKIAKQRSKKMKIDFLVQNIKNNEKLDAALKICNENNISFDEISYIGDDINCINLLSKAKFAACPFNAVKTVKELPNILVLSKSGGEGVIREYVTHLINKNLI